MKETKQVELLEVESKALVYYLTKKIADKLNAIDYEDDIELVLIQESEVIDLVYDLLDALVGKDDE